MRGFLSLSFFFGFRCRWPSPVGPLPLALPLTLLPWLTVQAGAQTPRRLGIQNFERLWFWNEISSWRPKTVAFHLFEVSEGEKREKREGEEQKISRKEGGRFSAAWRVMEIALGYI